MVRVRSSSETQGQAGSQKHFPIDYHIMAANILPSSTDPVPFEYKQVVLPSAATHIRLIQLFCSPTTGSSSGSSYDAPLKCRMLPASLERPPPFIALSYTWGNS